MLTIIGSLLSTVLGGLVTAYNKSKDVTITSMQTAATVAVAQANAMSAWIGHPFSPPSIMAYAVAIWFFKACALDKVVGPALGYNWSTDPLSGQVLNIAMIVVSGMFVSGVFKIWRG